jgi:PKD repeat protein
LDTQSRVENIGGTDSSIGSTATYNPGDSFGWDIVTLQVNPGQSGILTADVAQLCKGDLAAWGLPANTQCTLAGIEIGTEGYLVNSVNVDWYNVGLNIGPIPLSTSFTMSPGNLVVNKPVTFTSATIGGTSPYAINWNFGDGSTGTGSSIVHTFTGTQTFAVTETATDSSSPKQTATSLQSVIVYVLSAIITASTSSPQVGQTITFTASAAGGTAPYSYSISFGDGATGTGISSAHAYSTAGSYLVTLTVTDSASPQAKGLATTTVNVQAPSPLTLALPGNRTVTSGTWINFTVTGTSSNPARTVTLSVSLLPASATFDPSTGVFSWKPTASQTGYYTITFIATDDSTPPTTTAHPMGIQVDRAAPAPPAGGSPGGSGGTPGGCLLCGTFPAISSSMWLLLIGGLLGLVTSLAFLTIKARASLEHTKRRLNLIQRDV